MNKHHVVLLILSLVAAGCVKPEVSKQPPAAASAAPRSVVPPAQPAKSLDVAGVVPPTNYPSIMTDAYAQVNLSDGVSDEEAAVLAEAYFMGYITGCGMIGDVSDQGEKWEIQTFIDYSHTPYNPIQVSKKTGRIVCAEGPVVAPPPKR